MEKILSIPVDRLEFSSVDSNLAKVKLYVMHEGLNLNESVIPLDAIKDAENTISNIPILAYVNKDANNNGTDFGGHELEQKLETVNGELMLKTTFLEQPIGVVPETNNYHYEEVGGQQWVVVDGYIWKNYSNEAYDILSNAKTKGISMEIKVLDGNVDSRTGFYVINKFAYLGITVLGDDITPAMGDGAKIEMFSMNNKQEYFSRCKQLNEELRFELEKEVNNLKFAKDEKKIEDTGAGYANGLDVKEEIKQIKEAEMMSDDSEEKELNKKEMKDMKDDMKDAAPVHTDEEEDVEKHACKSEEKDSEKETCKDEEEDCEKESCKSDDDSEKESCKKDDDTKKHACKDEEETCEKSACKSDDDSEKHSIKAEKVATDDEDADNRKDNAKAVDDIEKVEEECDDKEDMAKCKKKKECYATEESDNSPALSINYITDEIREQLDKYKEKVKAWWSETGEAEMPKYFMIDLLVEQRVVVVSDYENHFYGISYSVNGDQVLLDMDSICPYIAIWKKKDMGTSDLQFELQGSKIKAVESLVNASKEHYEALAIEHKEMQEEVEKLRAFKLEIDKQTRYVEIDEIIGEFKFSDDEVSTLREKAYAEEISTDELKKELYALEGMRVHQAKTMYSASKKKAVLGYSINSKTESKAKTSKYGSASIYFR